jgi:hypothetical protein
MSDEPGTNRMNRREFLNVLGGASAASSRSTRAPSGPSNQSACAFSTTDSNYRPFLKKTSEVRMLQVKYAAKCLFNLPTSKCARCAPSPTTISGSSSRLEHKATWSPSTLAMLRR